MTPKKINLLEAARNVIRDDPHLVDAEKLAYELDLDNVYWAGDIPGFDERVKGYFLSKNYCTDSWVGLQAIFFDDRLVAIMHQEGRKSDPEYWFVDRESALELRQFMTVTRPEPELSYIDPNEEINDHYTLEYANGILDKKGFYNGEPVEYVMKHVKPDDPYKGYLSSKIVVKHATGATQVIDCRDYFIPLAVAKPQSFVESLTERDRAALAQHTENQKKQG